MTKFHGRFFQVERCSLNSRTAKETHVWASRSNHTIWFDYPFVFHSSFLKRLFSKCRPAPPAPPTQQLPAQAGISTEYTGCSPYHSGTRRVSSHSFCRQENKNYSTLATDFHMDTGINQTRVCLPLNHRVRLRWGEEFAVVSLRDRIPNSARDRGVPVFGIADYYNHQQTHIHIQGKCSNSHICIHFTLTWLES